MIMKTKTTFFFNKNIYFLALLTIIIVFLPRFAFGQTYGTANHQATVTVNVITVWTLTPGTINLAIPGGTAVAVAGQDQMTVTDNSSLLKWGTNTTLKKITIQSSITPVYELHVLVTNIAATPGTAGTVPGEVILSLTPQDLLRDLARSSGHCTLLYTLFANASQGIGNESYSLTLTMAAQ